MGKNRREMKKEGTARETGYRHELKKHFSLTVGIQSTRHQKFMEKKGTHIFITIKHQR